MKSFAILRTNPGLTTNVKVVVDSSYGLSLDSIESTSELATTRLKKSVFNKKNYFDELVPYFFKNFPSELAYHIKYDNDADSMTDEFAHQYDEIYQYGARNIVSNKDYSEEFEYFAPIHIVKGKIPKAFVIFRVDGPGMIRLDKENIRDEIFDSFKTVKFFDMTKATALGEWLDLNFVSNEYYPDAPLEISFERLEFSQWNGISYDTGGYTTKSMFLEDYLGEEKEIFELDRFVFDGYKNNKMVYPHIINFSFLFDDTPADANGLRKWSINRYYGFYIENLDLVKTMSPYKTPFIKSDAVIKKGNILHSDSGDPFVEGWSDDRTFFVEYNGEYYKVEKFIEKQKDTLKKTPSMTPPANSAASNQMKSRSKEAPIAMPVDRLSGPTEEPVLSKGIGSGTTITESKTPTFVDRYRIIAPMELTGKQAMLNANIGYIDDSDKSLKNYDNTDLEIEGFELADIWLIEIDGRHHNLIKEDGKIKVFSDYSFKFYENYYEYWINKPDPAYTRRGEFTDANAMPAKFKIYRIALTDIKDFDDRIVDTEFSKYEYEKEDDLTDTEETKLYLNNLNSASHPKDVDDFQYKNKVVNIPVSSEYTANHETFKIVNGDLTPLWRKNPVYCRWAFEDSLSANDYPYVLNNSIRFEEFNRTVNPFDPDPDRKERNLDYFYTINSSTFSYLHHSLHVENNDSKGIARLWFDFDRYLGNTSYIAGSASKRYNFDYFSWFFDRSTTFLSGKIRKNVKKFSLFSSGDNVVPNVTLFRGIKFLIHDVEGIVRSADGQISRINVKTSNSFEDYKFSILLSQKWNGMFWDIVEEWKMATRYAKGEIAVYNDILYRARRDHRTDSPVVSRNSLQIKALPYNLDADWEYYINDLIPLYSPLKAENKYYEKDSIDFMKSVVFNSGDYYMFNGYEKPIDFWSPIVAYRPNSRLLSDTGGRINLMGYSAGSIVLYRGEYYRSVANNNIYPPNYVQEAYENGAWKRYWEKIPPIEPKRCRWVEIRIWNPSVAYAAYSFIVHNNVLYRATEDRVPSAEEPGKSGLWVRQYSFEPDTDFVYTPAANPLIRMNGEYYQMISNPYALTPENGIQIYINKKWKNILVNIAINDNTVTGLTNTDRDRLYRLINKKLTAMNFIECVNNLSNKFGFTDYLKYIVIEKDGAYKTYDYKNIDTLPHIIFAERPQQIDVKAESLTIKQVKADGIKPTKVLDDGRIESLSQLNYFNKTHVATTIDSNLNEPAVIPNYHGGTNITTNTLFRFSGNYFPLFNDVELFKKDNATEYNEMFIALDLDETQDLVFTFAKGRQTVTKLHTIYPGASYSLERNSRFAIERLNPERPPAAGATASPYRRLMPVDELRNVPPITGIEVGTRYIVGRNPSTDWLGTFSIAGTSSKPLKKNSIAEWVSGYINPENGQISPSASVPNWTIANPIVSTWSYYAPARYDIVLDKSTNKDLSYNGSAWVETGTFSTEEMKFAKRYSVAGVFTQPTFYNQIRNIILGESLFSGVEFIFEINARGSQYIPTGIDAEFGKYDNLKSEAGLVRNPYILMIKYKSSYGDLRVDIARQVPTLIVNFIDSATPGSNLLVSLGATGINPPFQWSIGYTASSSYDPYTIQKSAYSTADSFVIPDASSTNWIFDIEVKDAAGLTSNSGYYIVNSGNQFDIRGTFSYVSL